MFATEQAKGGQIMSTFYFQATPPQHLYPTKHNFLHHPVCLTAVPPTQKRPNEDNYSSESQPDINCMPCRQIP